ncbi:MAG: ZIP family metal transporter [Rhodospirillales bacterium]
MSPDIFLVGMTAVIVGVAFVAGLPILVGRSFDAEGALAARGEAVAAGVFLGAGLIHMLGDAAGDFAAAGVDYPWPFLLCGAVVLALLLVEHIGAAADGGSGSSATLALLATAMLSVHSFLAGAALGTSGMGAVAVVIFIAIVAHKWAASFALAVTLIRSPLARATRIVAFVVFVFFLPLGVAVGAIAAQWNAADPLIAPTLKALAAGTFVYLGTLHGLANGTLVARCCELREFSAVVFGFALMAVVAIWT